MRVLMSGALKAVDRPAACSLDLADIADTSPLMGDHNVGWTGRRGQRWGDRASYIGRSCIVAVGLLIRSLLQRRLCALSRTAGVPLRAGKLTGLDRDNIACALRFEERRWMAVTWPVWCRFPDWMRDRRWQRRAGWLAWCLGCSRQCSRVRAWRRHVRWGFPARVARRKGDVSR